MARTRKPAVLAEVSAADRETFRAELADVVQLRGHSRFVHPLVRLPPIPRMRQQDEMAVIAESMHDPVDWDLDSETGEDIGFLRPGLSRHTLKRMRRGEWVTQAELDLHGLTRSQAKPELAAFLYECLRRGVRCARIIHGKGLGSHNREPVLRQHVRHWLSQRDEVLAYAQARPVDGGSGALIVLLKSSAY
jgi:DNA-nicking Smr family endonuclease